MKTSRRELMEQYITNHDTVSMAELCERFNISINTARVDVAYLVEKGVAKKVYGGVCSNQGAYFEDFEKRRRSHMEAKKAISKYAASLIEDNDVIFIDSGTTTMYILGYLQNVKNVTVLTTNLSIVQHISSNSDVKIFILPGQYEQRSNSVSDISTTDYLSAFNISKSFIGVSAVTEEGTLSNYSTTGTTIKKTAMRNSSKRYLLIDSSKFGHKALMTLCHISDMDEIITDAAISDKHKALCLEAGVKCKFLSINLSR